MAIRRCPSFLREDAVQEAWLAVAEGRNPDSAVRALVRRERRQQGGRGDLNKVNPDLILRVF